MAAARAQLEGGGWSRLDGAQRARLLSKLADLVERDAALLADMDANAIGRSPMEPRMMDVPNAVANLRAAAGWANQLEGRTIPTGGYMGTKTLSYTIREPIGRAGAGRRATQVARVQAGNGTTQHGADESLQQPGDVHIAHLPRRSGSSAMQVDFTFGPGMAFHR